MGYVFSEYGNVFDKQCCQNQKKIWIWYVGEKKLDWWQAQKGKINNSAADIPIDMPAIEKFSLTDFICKLIFLHFHSIKLLDALQTYIDSRWIIFTFYINQRVLQLMCTKLVFHSKANIVFNISGSERLAQSAAKYMHRAFQKSGNIILHRRQNRARFEKKNDTLRETRTAR